MYKIDSVILAQCIDRYCKLNEIPKYEFNEESGISSATLTQWRKGSDVSMKSLNKLESYLDMPIDDFMNEYGGNINKSDQDDGEMEILEYLRRQPEMRILFHASKGVPPSEVLKVAAQLMKFKEDSENK